MVCIDRGFLADCVYFMKKMAYKICRICCKKGYELLNLDDPKHNYYYKLTSCIPEIVCILQNIEFKLITFLQEIYIFKNIGLCKKCAHMLDTAFELREICLKNEKKSRNELNKLSNHTMGKTIINDEDGESITLQPNIHDSCNSEMSDLSIIETTFCGLCNKEFSSCHDKKIHDYKSHRQLKYKELRNILPPTNNGHNLFGVQLQMSDMLQVSTETSQYTNTVTVKPKLDDKLVCRECSIAFTHIHELEYHNLIHLKKVCHVCDKLFKTKNELDVHMKLHFARCCGESFATASLLQLHTFKEHQRNCGICDERFNNFNSLFHHLLDHTEGNWFKCNFCNKQFKESIDLETHNCRYYTCQKCDIVFFTLKAYNMHMQSHTSEDLQVNILGKKKTTRDRRKFRSVSFTRKKSYVCQLCSEQFKLLVHLKVHMLRFHYSGLLTIPLVDCREDNFYKEQEGLSINFEIPSKYHVKRNRLFLIKKELKNRTKRICFICQIMYSTRTDFAEHAKKVHQICCNKKMESLLMIIRHNFKHCNEKTECVPNKILCVVCAQTYENYTCLLTHKCGSYKLLTPQENTKSSSCKIELLEDGSITGKKSSQNTLDIQCEICAKLFDNRSTLLQHIKIHF